MDNDASDTNNNNFFINIDIIGFCDENISIDKADTYHLSLNNKDVFNTLIAVFAGNQNLNQNYDIKINNLSVNNSSIAKKYLQQNCLILSKNALFCDKNLSVIDNIKIVSQLYSGFNLSDACISSFMLSDIKHEIVDNLATNQQIMMLLSYVVCCPAVIWIIDNQLLNNLNEEDISIVNNAIKIRQKHGGIVLIVSYQE